MSAGPGGLSMEGVALAMLMESSAADICVVMSCRLGDEVGRVGDKVAVPCNTKMTAVTRFGQKLTLPEVRQILEAALSQVERMSAASPPPSAAAVSESERVARDAIDKAGRS